MAAWTKAGRTDNSDFLILIIIPLLRLKIKIKIQD